MEKEKENNEILEKEISPGLGAKVSVEKFIEKLTSPIGITKKNKEVLHKKKKLEKMSRKKNRSKSRHKKTRAEKKSNK